MARKDHLSRRDVLVVGGAGGLAWFLSLFSEGPTSAEAKSESVTELRSLSDAYVAETDPTYAKALGKL